MQTTVVGTVIGLSDFADLQQGTRGHRRAGGFCLCARFADGTSRFSAALKGKSPKFDIYRRKETPASWHFSENERSGDLVVCVKESDVALRRALLRERLARGEGRAAVSGRIRRAARTASTPPRLKTAQAIDLRRGPERAPWRRCSNQFENVNVFPFMAKILGLQSPARNRADRKKCASTRLTVSRPSARRIARASNRRWHRPLAPRTQSR